MRTVWTAGLKGNELSEIKKDFAQSIYLRKRLTDILQGRIESTREKLVSSDTYMSPSWAHLQADGVGYERALREVINLLESESLKS